ncbi:lamin tail domain-containing protein [Roseiconus lacunae]|uniref:Lamin tail domain-containing protein n=1 Tax=Roseiconus lacunae TaxID=2605694 RepID=A0ABT7PQT8_9BACT|nr:lamin tail domain-containing protein [Roseiconus lacunae]MDM4018869.1 lamin tail domain-containing protein [Roseiconus lacunae]
MKIVVVLFAISLGMGNLTSDAGLIITEVMARPESGNVEHQYLEIYNRGSTAIDLQDYELLDPDFDEYFGSLSGVLAPEETIVLYNEDLQSFSDFNWQDQLASPVVGIRSLGVKWLSIVDDFFLRRSIQLREIAAPVAPADRDVFTLPSVGDTSEGWLALREGVSYTLTNLDSTEPSNFEYSDLYFGYYESSELAGIGTPGFQVFPTNSVVTPEPSSLLIFAVGSVVIFTRRSRPS